MCTPATWICGCWIKFNRNPNTPHPPVQCLTLIIHSVYNFGWSTRPIAQLNYYVSKRANGGGACPCMTDASSYKTVSCRQYLARQLPSRIEDGTHKQQCIMYYSVRTVGWKDTFVYKAHYVHHCERVEVEGYCKTANAFCIMQYWMQPFLRGQQKKDPRIVCLQPIDRLSRIVHRSLG